ncbi:right-handed parallel beta-helix repeat-containing protein [Micromonospora sp. CPCC 205371]|nr:right-handed parallel beta-helix repeat-containing protein [Micromonospora sp. CPCC 205371]
MTRSKRVASMAGAIIVLAGVTVLVGDVPAAQAARRDATCVGGVGDAATIQNAIDTSNPGDEVVITGRCLITATIKLRDERTYRGDARGDADGGGGVVLRQADGMNLPALLATETWVDNRTWVSAGIRIEHLTLDGNRAANTGTVGLMLHTWDSRVYDVRVQHTPGDGIRLTSLSSNGTMLGARNNSVNGVIADSFVENSGGAGIRVVDPENHITDWVLERSWISNSGGSGVDLDNAAGWQVRDLHVYESQEHAIDARRCYNAGIHDNYIEDFGLRGTAGSVYFGIRCTLQPGTPATFVGNKINYLYGTLPAASYVYLAVEGHSAGTSYAAVTGNALVGRGTARETGLRYALGAGTAITVASTGNLVAGMGTARSVGTRVTVTEGR